MQHHMEPWIYTLNIAGIVIGSVSVIWFLIKKKREVLFSGGATAGMAHRIFAPGSAASIIALALSIMLLLGYFIARRSTKDVEIPNE